MHRKSVCFVKSVRGAEPMEKRLRRGLSRGFVFAHMFFPGLSPGSVDNRVSVLRKESPLAAAERPSVASQ